MDTNYSINMELLKELFSNYRTRLDILADSVIYTSGNQEILGNVTVNGDFIATRGFGSVYNDYAEYFPKHTTTITHFGDIISLDEHSSIELYKKAIYSDKAIIGIHTEQYAYIIGGDRSPEGVNFKEYNDLRFIPVGLAGRIPVKVCTPVRKGEYIVPSNIPGIGEVFKNGIHDQMKIIGMALENIEDICELGYNLVKVKIK
ncbi:MAG: hypothetical protein ACRC5T_05260 [Cetobacterium sp.]